MCHHVIGYHSFFQRHFDNESLKMHVRNSERSSSDSVVSVCSSDVLKSRHNISDQLKNNVIMMRCIGVHNIALYCAYKV